MSRKKKKPQFKRPSWSKDEDDDFPETRKELEAEGRENRRAAVAALRNLYGLSEMRAESYFSLVEQEPDSEVFSSIRGVFRATNNHEDKIRELEKAVIRYEQWVNKCLADPAVQTVLNGDLDSDKVEEALLGAGVKREEGMNFWDMPGWYDLEFKVVDFYHKIDDLPSPVRVRHMRELIGNVRAVCKDGKAIGVNKYLTDLAGEINKSMPEWMTNSPGQVPSVFVFRHEEYVTPALERMKGFRDSYLKLKDQEDMRFMNLVATNGLSGHELVRFATDRLDIIEKGGIDRTKVMSILTAVDNDTRLELFDYICRHPECLDLYKNLNKAGIKKDVFANFLLAHGKDVGSNREIYGVVEMVSSKGSQLMAAGCLVEHAAEFATDSNRATLEQIATNNAGAGIILDDYFGAVANGQSNRARLMLLLGVYAPDPSLLKDIRNGLKDVADDDIAWVSERPDMNVIRKRIRASTGAKIKQTKVGLKGKSWYDVMVHSLQKDAPPGVLVAAQDAYEKMPDYRHRLREVWRTQPDTLETFCRDMTDLHETEAHHLVMGNRHLFDTYKERLRSGDREFRAKLKEITQSASLNIYSAIYNLFHPNEEVVSEPEDVESSEKFSISLPKANRLVIWGGQYSNDAKKRIRDAARGLKVEVYDIFNRRRNISGIREGDVVVCVTTSMSHVLYKELKKYCKMHDIEFYHFNRAGRDPLIEFVQGLGA